MEWIDKFLKDKENENCLRTLKPASSRKNGRIILNNKEYLDFSSNDYLGLCGHPKLAEESKKALDKYGTASAASRLMTGDLDISHELEEKTAAFKKKASCLVFNTGYQANVGILNSLYGSSDCIFSDRLNHASIVDGIILSRAKSFRFRHNDMNHLESLLKKERNKSRNSLIITETIFSMDGDQPDLKTLVLLKNKYNCELMVDEAHATGIFGKTGSGVVEQEGLSEDVDLIMGTFSKALAGYGAYLACSKKVRDYLINTCRSFIFSTALPPSITACNLASLDIVREEPQRRKVLLESAEFFRQALKNKGLQIKGCSQIVPVIVGENSRALEFAKNIQEKGFWVLPIRPPTVPQGEARLRFSITFDHDKKALSELASLL